MRKEKKRKIARPLILTNNVYFLKGKCIIFTAVSRLLH